MSSTPAPPPMSPDVAWGMVLDGRLGEVLEVLASDSAPVLAPEEILAAMVSRLLRVSAVASGVSFSFAAQAQERGVIAASTAAGAAQWMRQRADDVEVPMVPSTAASYATVLDATRRPGMAPLKEATVKGQVTVQGAARVVREFERIENRIDPGCSNPALEGLISWCAAGATGRQLGEVRDSVLSQYGLDTVFQDDCHERARKARFTTFTRTEDGMYAAKVLLDPAAHAVVEAAMSALSAPTPAQEGFSDWRCADKRRADALIEVCSVVATNPDLLSQSAHTPQNSQPGRATRAQVIVTMPYQWLAAQTGYGTTAFDQPLAPGDVRRIACDAGIVPTVLGSPSEPLDLGRRVRLATPAQRAALAVRDKGCSFPGCDRPPGWCDAHHLRDWVEGGTTDLTKMALLCGRHHTIVHRDHLEGTAVRVKVFGTSRPLRKCGKRCRSGCWPVAC